MPPHTTDVEALPESVTITSAIHPYRGRPLRVLRQFRRHGVPTLLLLFPDGGRCFVPLAETDAAPGREIDAAPRSEPHLASLACLLRTRALVDALLQRLPAAEETHDETQPAVAATLSGYWLTLGAR